jgi:hypothetical protein
MKSTNWKDIAELIGIAAIVVSLILVAYELRQASAQSAAEAIYQTNVGLDNSYRARAQDSALAQLIIDGHANPGLLNDLEREQFAAWLRADLNIAEATWVFYENGLYPEWAFDGTKAGICGRLVTEGGRQFWEDQGQYFASRFRESIDEWCFQ